MIIKRLDTIRCCYFLILIITYTLVSGCNSTLDNNKVLNELNRCYYDNKPFFDSLATKLSDTTFSVKNLNSLLKTIKLKSNEGYETLFYTPNSITHNDDERTFYVKELGYGIQSGFFHSSNETNNVFENPRMVYRRIQLNWFSFIYFN
jgi:hypothetical protein